jgi:hypothetical protein
MEGCASVLSTKERLIWLQLPALAGSLDIREVFQDLGALASRIVPHDEANLALETE